MKTKQPAALDGRLYPPRAYASYVVVILMLITVVSLLDRNLLTLLVGPIRKGMGISDTQIGLLQGAAFALFYSVLGLPFGWLVDRANRRNLILAGLLVWCAATVCSGFAQNFWQLFVSRMGVGIGEAVLAPAAYSLIADYFEPTVRGRAISTYYAALLVGSGASLILGGVLLRLMPAAVDLPWLGQVAPWQMVFIVAGLPGLLAAPLLLTVREPPRISRVGLDLQVSAEERTLPALFAHIWRNRGAFASVYVCFACVAFAALPVLFWAPTLFVRKFGVGLSQIGMIVGFTIILGGFAGAVLSGVVSDRFTRRGATGTRLRVAVVGWLFALPLFVAWPFVGDLRVSLAMFALISVLSGYLASSGPPSVQELAPNHMRGQAVAIYLLIVGLVGMGLATALVGGLNDHLFRSDQALPYSLALVSGPAAVLGLLAAWLGLKPFDRTRLSPTVVGRS